MKRINLNNNVRVKLTEHGHKIVQNHYEKLGIYLNTDLISLIPDIDNEGFQTFQLWVFMSIFGEHIYMGSAPILEHNEIWI